LFWIPAFAGMTRVDYYNKNARKIKIYWALFLKNIANAEQVITRSAFAYMIDYIMNIISV
jgi:hypothetical protein